MQDLDAQFGLAMRIIDDAWNEVARGLAHNYPLYGLPQVSPEEASRKAAIGVDILARIEAIDLGALPDELALTIEVARARAATWAKEEAWYWTVYPGGFGFFGLFAATAYSGGLILNDAISAMAALPISDLAAGDRYLALIADYARLVRQLAARTAGQTARDIRMPRVQAEQAVPLLQGVKARSLQALAVSHDRGRGVTQVLTQEVERRLKDDVSTAFDDFMGQFGDAYLAAAPADVGISQYPQGAEIYEELVKIHTTLDLTPEAVHEVGLTRIASIRAQMAELRAIEGFDGDDNAYRANLDVRPDWRAGDAAGVEKVFQSYIDSIGPHLAEYFSFGPKAVYGVQPLPTALEGAMTFGFYSRPTPSRRAGYYMFNTANLTKAGLYTLGALTYHELVPGHHYHLASQQENAGLHPLRANSFINAYNEGWAEYAATLAGEMGLYPTPPERFGRLVMDAFLTCRLVVDTGMNALGWSLEQARDFMRANSFMPEAEIRSESIRYSCDIPGQSLAYKLGDSEILRMRDEMREALGNRFDIRDFHDAVLKPGGLPLPVLAAHVAKQTRRLQDAV